ncbi:MAG: hypothetical protein EXR93_06465 [Gemmatimonadetes bacterium]|nr:hypothetical protein [Gemmatimonadota bacterium]
MAAKRPAPSKGGRSQVLPWAIAGVAGVSLIAVLVTGRTSAPRHPDPRPNAQEAAAAVMPPSFFASDPRVMRAYQVAREIPDMLDGLYCYCECKEHLGHRSLLTCYNSQHGAGCDVCIGEAEMAYDMVKQGRALADIRTAIDLANAR